MEELKLIHFLNLVSMQQEFGAPEDELSHVLCRTEAALKKDETELAPEELEFVSAAVRMPVPDYKKFMAGIKKR